MAATAPTTSATATAAVTPTGSTVLSTVAALPTPTGPPRINTEVQLAVIPWLTARQMRASASNNRVSITARQGGRANWQRAAVELGMAQATARLRELGTQAAAEAAIELEIA